MEKAKSKRDHQICLDSWCRGLGSDYGHFIFIGNAINRKTGVVIFRELYRTTEDGDYRVSFRWYRLWTMDMGME